MYLLPTIARERAAALKRLAAAEYLEIKLDGQIIRIPGIEFFNDYFIDPSLGLPTSNESFSRPSQQSQALHLPSLGR